jgi:hypothetical protein
MTFFAVCFVFHIKGSFTVMADTAELTLVDLAHVHFRGALFHLENMIVTGAAL